jgi:hypothetical protein
MATKKKTEADSKGKSKFSSPVDMQEHGAEKAPEMRKEMTVEEMDKFLDKYRGELLGTPFLDDVQVPGPAPADDWREGFEKEYGWIAPNNVIGFYRAILQELYRMRVGK